MGAVSILIGLSLSAVLGIGISAAGLHLLLSLIPGKQLEAETQIAPRA